MVILSHYIPFRVIIVIAVVLLILIAAILIIIHKSRKKRKKSSDICVNNTIFEPSLPISNIIKDKIRKPVDRNAVDVKNKNKIVMKLTELPSGAVHCVKTRKNITIGRKRSCNISIKDVSVAPVHCSIFYCNGQICIEDNNTLNGTVVNGILIKNRIPLFTNDLILIGNKEYKVDFLLP